MTVGDHNWALGLRINGRELAPEYRKTVQSVKVLQDLESAGSVTLAVSAPRDEVLAWFDKAKVDEGSPIEVDMGTADHVDLVFAGDITGLEVSFGGRLAVSLSLRGYDRRHRLMRSYNPGSHTKVKDSKLVADIARKHGLEVKATATSIEHPYLLQAKQNDHKFLRERAEANGFELFIVGKTLYFRPCAHKDPPALRLSAESDLLEFHASVTSMNQASEVRVGGWDVANKRAIVGTATSATLGRGSGPSRSKSLFGPSLRADGEFPVASQAEAEARASAQLLELALGHLTADATLHGNSAIHPGMVVAIDDVGARFSGNYYVTSASHDFELAGSGRYETRLTMRRAAS